MKKLKIKSVIRKHAFLLVSLFLLTTVFNCGSEEAVSDSTPTPTPTPTPAPTCENGDWESYSTKEIYYGAAGSVSYYYTYSYDETGEQTQYESYNSPGSDGQWFTDDDYKSESDENTYYPSGNIETETEYSDGWTYVYTYADSADEETIKYEEYDSNGLLDSYGECYDLNALNQCRFYVNYSVSGGYEFSISSYKRKEYDANGNRTLYAYYTGAGSDGAWFTSDDNINYVYAYAYDANNNQTLMAYYGSSASPGPNGTWLDSDDVGVSWYNVSFYDANNNQIFYGHYTMNNDGTWFDNNDYLSSYRWGRVFDAQNRETLYVYYSAGYGYGPGDDGKPGTPDDVGVSYYYAYEYDDNGNQTLDLYYNGNGGDGTWFDGNDSLNYGYGYAFDAQNRQTLAVSYAAGTGSGPGSDGIPGTTNDVGVSGYSVKEYDANGNQTLYTYYNGHTNGTWFDGDDATSNSTAQVFNAENKITLQVGYGANGGPGADGIPGNDPALGTTDDIAVINYIIYEYDVNGNKIHEAKFTTAGSDSTWFTSDDVRNYTYMYTYNAANQKTLEVNYWGGHPGTDGTWLTDDDIGINWYRSYAYDANGNQIFEGYYTGNGGDGIWFDSSETLSSGFGYAYDTQNRQTLYVRYNSGIGNGPVNGTVGDTDDVGVLYYDTYTYDADGTRTIVSYNGIGAGTWFDGDDIISNYSVTKYDALGNELTELYCTNSGADGIWFTEDDLFSNYNENVRDASGFTTREVYYSSSTQDISGYRDIVNDVNGNPLSETEYNSPGFDGEWFTGDDFKQSYYEYEVFCITEGGGS